MLAQAPRAGPFPWRWSRSSPWPPCTRSRGRRRIIPVQPVSTSRHRRRSWLHRFPTAAPGSAATALPNPLAGTDDKAAASPDNTVGEERGRAGGFDLAGGGRHQCADRLHVSRQVVGRSTRRHRRAHPVCHRQRRRHAGSHRARRRSTWCSAMPQRSTSPGWASPSTRRRSRGRTSPNSRSSSLHAFVSSRAELRARSTSQASASAVARRSSSSR